MNMSEYWIECTDIHCNIKKLFTYYPDLCTHLLFHWFCFHLQKLYLQLTIEYNGCIWPNHPKLQMTYWHCCHYHDLWNSEGKRNVLSLKINVIHSLVSFCNFPFSHHHRERWFTILFRGSKSILWLQISSNFYGNMQVIYTKMWSITPARHHSLPNRLFLLFVVIEFQSTFFFLFVITLDL